VIPQRYIHNLPVYSEEDFSIIRKSRITVIGAGGLGGGIIDQFTRLGIGYLRIIDNDCFDISNLNRQLYSDTETIGASKAEVAAKRVQVVNPEVDVEAINKRLESTNARKLLEGSNLVFDAVDNMETKMLIQDICSEMVIAFIHGAVGSYAAQVSLVLPGQNTLDEIYNRDAPESYPRTSIPPFTPAIAASIQVSEGLKYLLGQHNPKKRTLLYFDLKSYKMMTIDMGAAGTMKTLLKT